MGNEKWDIKTSIGDWVRRRWVFIVPILLLYGCTQDMHTVATIEVGHIRSVRLVDFNPEFLIYRTEIVTDSIIVYVETDIHEPAIGARAWINRTNLGDFITWDGLKGQYHLR